MTVTRQQVRQQMIKEGIVDAFYGTASTGTTTSMTDVDQLAVGIEGPGRYGGYWLYRPNAASANDYYRRIKGDGFSSVTGKIEIAGPAYAAGPTLSSDDGYYEIWPGDMHPREINWAFTRALTTRCFSLQRESLSISTIGANNRYDIDADFSLTSITSIQDQVLEIVQLVGTEPDAYVRPHSGNELVWWPEEDNGTQYIRFDRMPSGTLQLTWRKPYADVTDETTTSTVTLTYASWATFYELFMALEKRAKGQQEAERHYAELKDEAFARYWGKNHSELGRFASMLHVPRPRFRAAFSAPVMGRMR